ncbi:MAG: branched-chain amino acid ABC transporter permease [Bacillota bacterium]
MALQTLINGIAVGGIYALIAIGYSLVFSILRVVNFAHGSLYMIGAFGGLILSHRLGLPFWVAFLGGLAAASLAAVFVERVASAPLRKRGASPMAFLISTLGMQLLLDTSGLITMGGETHPFPPPVANRTFHLLGATFTLYEVLILAVTVVLLLALELFLTRTRTGMAIRATAQNPLAAGLMGVNVNRVNAITFAIAGALGAAAGIMVGIYYNSVYPTMGAVAGMKGFAAAILGGLGSISGAVVGGLVLGVIENFGTTLLGSGLRDITAFLVMILVLVIRPSGLLGLPVREKV